MRDRLRLGSLFSGIGLLDLGLERVGFETVFQVEWDKQATKVLEAHWPHVKRCSDITQVDWATVPEIDVLAGGFPCQPFSSAGLRKGASDDRYLWPEFARAICALRPRVVIVENVSALLGSPEWGDVLGTLAEAGYDAKWACIRADDVGAVQKRDRIFVVAYRESNAGRFCDGNGQVVAAGTLSEERASSLGEWKGLCGVARRTPIAPGTHITDSRLTGSRERRIPGTGTSEATARADRSRLQGGQWQEGQSSSRFDWGKYESAIRRWERLTRAAPRPLTDKLTLTVGFSEWMMGVPEGWTSMVSRTAAIKGLGNGVVVQVAEEVGRWALEGL